MLLIIINSHRYSPDATLGFSLSWIPETTNTMNQEQIYGVRANI